MIENINKAFVEVILSGKILIMEFMILAGKIKTTFLQNSPIQPTHIVENNLNKAQKKDDKVIFSGSIIFSVGGPNLFWFAGTIFIYE